MENNRAGMRWLAEEEIQFLQELADNKSYEEIAKTHSRTQGAIKAHAAVVGLKKIQDGMSLVDAAQFVRMSADELTYYKVKNEHKKRAAEEKKAKLGDFGWQSLMPILTEIRDYLKIIAEK